jgi:uncharacterized protein YbaR (Trm112 family)
MFRLTCPKCGSPYDVAKLEVVAGTFRASKMWLREDGFATMDAKTFDTDEETVYCHVCERMFPLGDCLDDGPTPSFKPFNGYDWTELAARFGVAVPNEDDPDPLILYLEGHCHQDNVTATCREFLDAIITIDPTGNKPVWEGLAKVEKDEDFMPFFIHLLSWMWT